MSTADRPPLSIVICSRDRPEMLGRCVASAVAARGPDDEFLVVDSASVAAAEMTQTVTVHGDGVARLLRLDVPGASRARNAGWREARHDLVVFLDDDVWIDGECLDAFALAASNHPEAGFFTGRIDVPPEQLGTSRPVAIKDDEAAHAIDRTSVGTVGHSASLTVRRDALERIGGFDELLGAGARYHGSEDADLFDRLFTIGAVGRYEPTARAWHDQWRSRNQLVRLDWRYGVGVGARVRKLLADPHERPRARTLTRNRLWEQGLRQAGRDLRAGWQSGFVMRLAGVAGTLTGLTRATVATRVVDGHLRDRRDRRSPTPPT